MAMPAAAPQSSVQHELHGLAASLAAAYPAPSQQAALSPFPAHAPPSRADFRARVQDLKDAVAGFRPVWAAATEEQAKVKASGVMREWATSTSVLSTLPSVPKLQRAVASASGKRTPFALLDVPLPSLLETRAKRLGLEVYRETVVEDDDAAAAESKELLVLGGKVLVVELELALLAPIEGVAFVADSGAGGEGDVERWVIKKHATSLSLPASADPVPAPALDAFLRPPLEALLELLARPRTVHGGETAALGAARQMDAWEGKVRAALAHEAALADRPALFDEVAQLRALLSCGAGPFEEDLWPSVDLGRGRKLALVPPPANAPAAQRLPFLPAAPTTSPTPFLWEATFTPPLPLVLPSSSPSAGCGLEEQGYYQPPPGRGRAQHWTLERARSLSRIEVARVGLASAEEAQQVVEWARRWLWVLDFAQELLDGTCPPPQDEVRAEPSLDDLLSGSFPDTFVPISLALSRLPEDPHVLLTLPHPTLPLPLTILLRPTPSSCTLTLSPADAAQGWQENALGKVGAKVHVLGGRGVVLWLLKELGRVEAERMTVD